MRVGTRTGRSSFWPVTPANVATNLPDFASFSVAIDKKPAAAKGREPRETAWQWALQRVHRFCDHCRQP
jgi:hypothetical protein